MAIDENKLSGALENMASSMSRFYDICELYDIGPPPANVGNVCVSMRDLKEWVDDMSGHMRTAAEAVETDGGRQQAVGA